MKRKAYLLSLRGGRLLLGPCLMVDDITIAVACTGQRSHDKTGSQMDLEFRLTLF